MGRYAKCNFKLNNWLLNSTKMNSEGKAFIHVFRLFWFCVVVNKALLKWKCLAWCYSTPFSQYKGRHCMWKCTIIFYVQFIIAKKFLTLIEEDVKCTVFNQSDIAITIGQVLTCFRFNSFKIRDWDRNIPMETWKWDTEFIK